MIQKQSLSTGLMTPDLEHIHTECVGVNFLFVIVKNPTPLSSTIIPFRLIVKNVVLLNQCHG